ncbi:hypothetical protein Tco_1263910, partial [Tanacetum coccineum]
MRTRSQARRRRQPQVRQTSVESSNLEKPDNPPIVTMADNRTMAQLLEAPTEGYEDAIVIPEITANNFEIKHGLLNLVQNKQFFGNDKEDPHAHIRYFNKITSTMKIPNVPNTSVKLMLFPFSLEGAARIWLEKEQEERTSDRTKGSNKTFERVEFLVGSNEGIERRDRTRRSNEVIEQAIERNHRTRRSNEWIDQAIDLE